MCYTGYTNWIAHIHEILKRLQSRTHIKLQTKSTVLWGISNQCSKIRWQTEISEVPVGSDSGGRLALYRQIKHNPCTEKYLITMNSLGDRRVMAGLRFGCLPLAVEVGRYTGTPYRERVCRLCNCGEVEDQHHFLIILCHPLSSTRQTYFLIALLYQAPLHIYLLSVNVNFF